MQIRLNGTTKETVDAVAYLTPKSYRDQEMELNGFTISEIQQLAAELDIPRRYDHPANHARKPKAVLMAAILEKIRIKEMMTLVPAAQQPADQLSVKALRQFLFHLDDQKLTVAGLRQILFQIADQDLSDLNQISRLINATDDRPSKLDEPLEDAVLKYMRSRGDDGVSSIEVNIYFERVITEPGQLTKALNALLSSRRIDSISLDQYLAL